MKEWNEFLRGCPSDRAFVGVVYGCKIDAAAIVLRGQNGWETLTSSEHSHLEDVGKVLVILGAS